MAWPLSDDGQYYVFDGEILIPVDPSTGAAVLMLRPQGGMSVGIPAIEQGEPGDPPTLNTAINFTALEYNDPTADSASWTETSPDTYTLNLSLHKGSPGADGDTVLDPDDFGGGLAGQILVVNDTVDGFQLEAQKVGDRYIPASISNTPAGNATYTVCSVGVEAQPFDWRPIVSGQCIITGTGADVRVDLIARLNNASAGNIVGRGFGQAGVNPPPHILSFGPPAGSADSYDIVYAGESAVIYLRAERQTGAETFTTSSSTTWFCVQVMPLPTVTAGS